MAETKQTEQLEQDRIKRERTAAKQELEQQRKACYQKLAVTPCLNEARDQHSEKVRDLKRQEVALNDVKRKRAAAERVHVIEKRNSPEAQLAQAERRGKALQASQKREESRIERERSRQAKQAKGVTKPQVASAGAEMASPTKKAQGKAHSPRDPSIAAAQRAKEVTKAAQRHEQAARREKLALENQQKLQQREAKRKKPASASLPTPN